jgi:hypothetical protein
MPIQPIAPSETKGAFEVVHHALSRRALAGAISLPRLRHADPSALSLAMPHRVEFLAPGDIRRDTMPKKEKGDYWRFLVLEERATGADDGGAAGSATFEAIAAATAVKEGRMPKFGGLDKRPFVFGGLDEGPFVKGTEQTILRAEDLRAVREGQFEAVLLVVPALYVLALWLQDLSGEAANGRSGEADLIIPLPPPSNPGLDPHKPMAPASFLKALKLAR